MNHLVVGCGEVGQALMRVLGCSGHDPYRKIEAPNAFKCDILHICFPFIDRDEFHRSVRQYQECFTPLFTVIHSTVPIGSSGELSAHHSPVRGRHPHLEESLNTFIKYVGGPYAQEICEELRSFGIPACGHPSSRDIEAGKLVDLMQFGASILIEKEIHAFCEKNGLDFNIVYLQFNETYNSGYRDLGSPRFIRPVLDHQDGPIGGHCVVENMKHLDSKTARQIIEANSDLKKRLMEAAR